MSYGPCWRLAARLACVLACTLALAAGQDGKPATATQSTVTPVAEQRGTEQTFLTFPEWFLVYSPAEYAHYVAGHTPTLFPFLGHIRQFWQSYARVSAAASDGYPLNFGYHVMIMVIGTSTSVEYAIRSAYENLVGRLSEAVQRGGLTEEDRYGAKVAQEYVDFIRIRPWYEFDFGGRLKGLWRETAFTGPDMVRKWERKYALTTEYMVKAAYGWLIGKATHASYGYASSETAVVVDKLPEGMLATLPESKLLHALPDDGALLILPRYQPFTHRAMTLAQAGVNFREIAGNRSVILVSILSKEPPDRGWLGTEQLFEQPVITEPGTRRLALVIPVEGLASSLRQFARRGVTVEHIYDY